MNKTWMIAALTAVLGAATFWLWRQLEDSPDTSPGLRRHEPDYYLVEMVRRTMNREGGLQNVLTAEEVFHYPDDDTLELAHPHMEIYNGDENPWQIVAERGIVKSNNEVIFLHGKVEIWRIDAKGEREYEILTSELRVFPKVQYAETDNSATIKTPSTVTKTRGFRANFEHNRLELLEQVRTRYEKPFSA